MSWLANQSSGRSGASSFECARTQVARARDRGRLDEEDLTADRRPGEPGRDTGVLRPAALLGEETSLAEQLPGALG